MTAATVPDLAATPGVTATADLITLPVVALAALAPGHSACVVAVDGSCPESERLLDLGFVPGTRVDVLKRAPLGDPVVYGLRGYRICLRASEANLIRVRPE